MSCGPPLLSPIGSPLLPSPQTPLLVFFPPALLQHSPFGIEHTIRASVLLCPASPLLSLTTLDSSQENGGAC
eukprot:69704-Hanusia_phi.AAC.1